jgi:cytochrome P450
MGAVTDEVVRWNPFSESYFQDPHPHLHACRATNPIQRGPNGEWILFRYDHIREILRAPDFDSADLPGFFRKKEPVIFKNTTQCPYLARTTAGWVTYLDGDAHTRMRTLIETALGRFDLKSILPVCIGRLFRDHLRGEVLEGNALGAAVPVLVFNSLYGGSWDNKEGIDLLRRVSHSLATAQEIFVPVKTYHAVNEDMQWLFEMVRADFEKNRKDRPLLTYMFEENEKQGFNFSTEEMTSMVCLLVLASVETTRCTITSIVYELLTDRTLIQYINSANEVMINVLAEEFFRLITPQQYTIRVNKEQLTFEGKTIPAGSRLYLPLTAANRDPSVFPEPDQIVRDRKNNPHLAFGTGLHSCVGSKLARTEIRLLLKPLALALQAYELDATSKPVFDKSIFARSFLELRIVRS